MDSKRLFDLFFVLIFSPIILCLFLIVFFLSKIFNKKKIFFIQERGGFLGKKIFIIKFRTMGKNKKKITTFNNFLRKSKLDELPQFYNVLIGEMSIVGPRPLHYKYKSKYSKKQLGRFLSKPGITGLAQISKKKNLSWTEQFQIDLKYNKKKSLILDLKIILITLVILLKSLFKKNSELKDKKLFTGKN